MADGVRLDIVLTDDGQPATRPAAPEGFAAPRPGIAGVLPGVGARKPDEPVTLDAVFELLQSWDGPITKGAAPGGGEEGGEEGGGGGKPKASWIGRLKQAGELLEGGARRFAAVMSPLAGNDYLGAFKETATIVAEGLTLLGAKGQQAAAKMASFSDVAASLTTSFKGVVESFAGVVGSFIERGKQLAQFSPELAMSGARAEVRSMMADVREAQELGPGVARMQDAQTELMGMLRDTLLPLKKWVVETLAGLMETLIKLARDGYIVAQDIYLVLSNMPDLITFKLKGTLWDDGEFKRMWDDMRIIMQGFRREKPPPKVNPLDDLVDRAMAEMMGRAVEAAGRPDPVLGGA
jgi:hypothetical protein